MVASLRAFLILGFFLIVVTGIVYPWGVTTLARWAFPDSAQGRLAFHEGRPVGSWLVAQPFHSAGFFKGRLESASASGVDPHISPAAAWAQIPAVADARGMEIERLRALVKANTEGREAGLLGEPRVNVLRLNLALDPEAAESAWP